MDLLRRLARRFVGAAHPKVAEFAAIRLACIDALQSSADCDAGVEQAAQDLDAALERLDLWRCRVALAEDLGKPEVLEVAERRLRMAELAVGDYSGILERSKSRATIETDNLIQSDIRWYKKRVEQMARDGYSIEGLVLPVIVAQGSAADRSATCDLEDERGHDAEEFANRLFEPLERERGIKRLTN